MILNMCVPDKCDGLNKTRKRWILPTCVQLSPEILVSASVKQIILVFTWETFSGSFIIEGKHRDTVLIPELK